MPNDQPDWTQSVDITGGSVDITAGTVQVGSGQNGTNVTVDTPPKLLGTISISSGNTASGTFNLDSNATGLIVVLKKGGGYVGGTYPRTYPRVTITGGVTGVIYSDLTNYNIGLIPAVDGVVAQAAIQGNDDNAVTVACTWQLGAGSPQVIAYVYEVFATGIQQVYSSQQQPLNVQNVGPGFSRTSLSNAVVVNSGAAQDLITGIGTAQILVGWKFCLASQSPTAGSSIRFQLVGEQSAGIVEIDGKSMINSSVAFADNSPITWCPPTALAKLLPNDSSCKVHIYNVGSGAPVIATVCLYFL